MNKEYVEREVISEGIRKYYYKNPPNSSYEEGFDRGLDKAQRVILNAPAADVAPVVHGEWIDVDTSYWRWYHDTARTVFSKSFRCSECGRKTIIREKFCPSCGTKMDKEKV